MHTVITQPAQENPGMSTEGPLKALISGTYRGPSGASQGTNAKFMIYDLSIKLYFRSNMGTSARPLQVSVAGRPGYQLM